MEAKIHSRDQAEALEQQAHDLTSRFESVRLEALARSNEKIAALEQKARDLASFVETTRQQILAQSDSKIAALEQKARALAEFVESLRYQTRLESDHEIDTLRERAKDLALFVESVRKETRLQFATEIDSMRLKAQNLAISVEAVREITATQSESEIAMLGQTHTKMVLLNEALVLGSLRQGELAEASEKLNAQLLVEISERKHAEAALRENAWRLRYATESARLTYVEADLIGGGARTPENFAEVMGYDPPPGQAADISHGTQLLLAHVVSDDRAQVQASHQEFVDGKVAGQLEYRVLGDDLIERWIETRWTVELAADGTPLKSFATNLDITERKQAEQALVDLHRRKDEFLAMLSHELRSPLAPISNAVHLLRLQKHEDPLQLQARTIIERQVGQLKHLIDDLLEVSRITTGRVQLRLERNLLSSIVERAVETVNPLILQRGHALTVSQPPEPIWVQADAARLEQVLVNLLTNAGKYTDEAGQIWLTVHQEGNSAVLRVRDNGVGIAPQLLPRIFDLFTQADRSLDRSQGGLGIGLCLVQRLVELHGGSVSAHSVLGQGSEFVVRLPALMPSEAAAPLPAIETARAAGTSCSVLVVDDNVDAARSMAYLLELSGHKVEVAHDGVSALAAALAMQPDVVLLDIGLPGLSGWEVAMQIRQRASAKHVVLVALTGYGQETDRERSQNAGFDHHLVKPADFETVQKILASVGKTKL